MTVRTVRYAKTTGFNNSTRHELAVIRGELREQHAENERKIKCRYRYLCSVFFYNRKAHYDLYRGDAKFGKSQTMDGNEVIKLNKEYENKFIDGKTDRLWRWKLRNFSNFNRQKKQFADYHLDGTYDEDYSDYFKELNEKEDPI